MVGTPQQSLSLLSQRRDAKGPYMDWPLVHPLIAQVWTSLRDVIVDPGEFDVLITRDSPVVVLLLEGVG